MAYFGHHHASQLCQDILHGYLWPQPVTLWTNNPDPINIPPMLAYIYHTWILWEWYPMGWVVLQRFVAFGFLRFPQVHVIHVVLVVDHGGTHGTWATILEKGWKPCENMWELCPWSKLLGQVKTACHGGSNHLCFFHEPSPLLFFTLAQL